MFEDKSERYKELLHPQVEGDHTTFGSVDLLLV